MHGGSDSKAVRIRVTGFVQGVGFRYFVRREADRIGVTGFVRNLPDGSVESVAAGRSAAVDEFVRRVRSGPPSALVREAFVEEIELPEAFDRFDIRF